MADTFTIQRCRACGMEFMSKNMAELYCFARGESVVIVECRCAECGYSFTARYRLAEISDGNGRRIEVR